MGKQKFVLSNKAIRINFPLKMWQIRFYTKPLHNLVLKLEQKFRIIFSKSLEKAFASYAHFYRTYNIRT